MALRGNPRPPMPMPDPPRLPVRKRHRLPAESYALTDHAYFFTLCARHHSEPFLTVELAKAVIESLIWTRNRYEWQLYCYCLMPDHLHFMCRLTVSGQWVNGGRRGHLPE